MAVRYTGISRNILDAIGDTPLVEIDGILVNLLQGWLDHLADTHGVSCTQDDVAHWDLRQCAKLSHLTHAELYQPFNTPNWFGNLHPIDGALEAVEWVHNCGHDIKNDTLQGLAAGKGEKLRRQVRRPFCSLIYSVYVVAPSFLR